MANREKFKRELFTMYSTDLLFVPGNVFGLPQDGDRYYVCPLCYNYFNKDALYTNQKEHLTLEDCPPKAIGGKPIILTCKNCNNTLGSKVDSHLTEIIKYRSAIALDKGAGVKAVLKGANKNLKGEFTVNELGETHLFLPNGANRPEEIEKLNRELRNGDKVDLSMFLNKRMDNNMTYLSILKAAHLYAFKILGHAYLMTPTANFIRTQLQNPDSIIFEGKFYMELPQSVNRMNLNMILKPKELESLFVSMPLRYGSIDVGIGVFLPVSVANPNELWRKVELAYKSHKIDFSGQGVKMLNLISPRSQEEYMQMLGIK